MSFLGKFGQMFTRSLPSNLPADELSTTMGQWQNFWMSPAIMAAIVFVVFALFFWDRTKAAATGQELAGSGAAKILKNPN